MENSTILTRNNNCFCLIGAFLYEETAIDLAKLRIRYCNWIERLERDNIEPKKSNDYFQKVYYENYLKIAMPFYTGNKNLTDNLRFPLYLPMFLTVKAEYLKPISIEISTSERFDLNIDFIDLFFYEYGIAVFSIKFTPVNENSLEKTLISIKNMRQLDCLIKTEKKRATSK